MRTSELVDEILKLSIIHEDRDVHPNEDPHCRWPLREIFLCNDQSIQHVKNKLRQSVLSILLMRAENGGSQPGHCARIDLFLGETENC